MTIELSAVSSVARQALEGVGERASSTGEPAHSAPGATPGAADASDSKASNANATSLQGKLQMNVDPQTSQLIIQVVDGNSTQIIRKIPAEEVVEFAHGLDSAAGNIIQSKA